MVSQSVENNMTGKDSGRLMCEQLVDLNHFELYWLSWQVELHMPIHSLVIHWHS